MRCHIPLWQLTILLMSEMLLVSCASTRDVQKPAKGEGFSVVYQYPKEVVLAAVQHVAQELDLQIAEINREEASVILTSTGDNSYKRLLGSYIGIALKDGDFFSTIATITTKRKNAVNVFAKDYTQNLHERIVRRLETLRDNASQVRTRTVTPLYAHPITRGSPLEQLPSSTPLKVLFQNEKWYFIAYNQQRGWVEARQLDSSTRPVESAVNPPPAPQGLVPALTLPAGDQQRRLALVIGNASYRKAPLRNASNDATDMAAALRRVGFEAILLKNATHKQMEDAIENFARQLRRGGVGLFYYSGHGMQVSEQNYLIPIDARLETETAVKYEAVHLSWVLDQMGEAGNELSMVVLDACRNNPFARQWRSDQQGLAVTQAARGTLIAYATAPGSVAQDGQERNGTYTKHLLQKIGQPGLTVEQIFKQVRISVHEETKGQQTPWEASSLTGDFYFALSPRR